MTRPRLELLPLVAALPAGRLAELTVLARITLEPAALTTSQPRPPLNLALVLDRSGSMAGSPLDMAVLAAQTVIRQLGPQDRVAVLAFDDDVQTLVPSQQVARGADALARQLGHVAPGGSTALQAGWLAGAEAVATHLQHPVGLNRVILLSDGQANVGEQRAHVLAQQARELKARGVSTTAIGLGRNYDEDLMRGMADAGDGNFEHIEDPAALPAFFGAELNGLLHTAGHTVSLGIEPNPDLRTLKVRGLTDLPRNEFGRSQLPNLVTGRTTDFLFTLQLPPQRAASDLGVTRVRLAWTDAEGQRQRIRTQLNLPVLDPDHYARQPENPQVRAALDLLLNAKAKQEAVRLLDAGDVPAAQRLLRARAGQFTAQAQALAGVLSPQQLEQERLQLEQLAITAERDLRLSRKQAAAQHHQRSRSKTGW